MLCNTIVKRILQDIILPQLHLQKNLSKGEQEQHAMQDHSEKDFTSHNSFVHNSFFSPCVLPLVICLFLFFCPFSLLNQLHLHSRKNFYEKIAKEEMELAWKGCCVHLLILSQRNKFCNTTKVLKVIYTYITLHTQKKYTQDHVSVFQNIYMQIIKCNCNLQKIRNVNLYGHLDLHAQHCSSSCPGPLSWNKDLLAI